jgi:hypothetical protein
MKVLYKLGAYILRPIVNYLIFKPIYTIYYGVLLIFNSIAREMYITNKKIYDEIHSLDYLILFFKNKYKYKLDGMLGLFEHDNPKFEFFTNFGDCDDMSFYSFKKLKELGYKPVRICMIGKSIISGHMDCYFEKNGLGYLFNYGNIIKGTNLEDCMSKLSWYNDSYNNGNVPYYFKYFINL